MITQKFALPILLVLITDATAIFYFLKDHKHHHEEVDHHHHNHHHHDEHMHHMHKHHEEHKHHEHKPHHMHKHHEEHKPHHMHKHHEEHKPHHMHKHHEEHKHQHMHKHQEEHKHHQHHHHGHHHEEHKHEHKDHHDHHHHHEHHKHERQPHYEFKYGVRDPSTGDIKNQWEMRKGDDVKGEYSLVEADGTIRTVQYTAGKHTGFNAIVKKEGKAKHPIVMAPHPVVTHPKAYPESESKGKSSGMYTEVDSTEVDHYNPSNLPTNHKAVFSSIDEQSNLLSVYKNYPVNYVHGNEQRGFDYGINEYLTKRSYDLSKITDMLNAAPTIDPIRAVRGTFVMGR